MFKRGDIVRILIYKRSLSAGCTTLSKFCYYAEIPCHLVHPVSAGHDTYANQIVLYVNGEIKAITHSAYKMMRYLAWGDFNYEQ